ncbi:MAG: HNH endonuclease, partial [Actinobacteria bacterium]|nr:HNH endonuclease [Actinomycetota bacterium]
MTPLLSMSDQDLADSIVTWSGRIAAGEAELLANIGEFDRREAWGATGLLSCAHWLSWRTSLSPTAAREKVRVARALRELPLVQEAFGAGRLSYSQVRAITRVAGPFDQKRWVDAARSSTGGQLERLARGVRRARKVDEDAADPELAAFRMRATKSYDEDGNAVYRIVLPAEEAAIVDAALEFMRAELDRRAADASAEAASPQAEALTRVELTSHACAGPPSPRGATLAEGLVEMARTALESRGTATARRTRSSLVTHVDPLSGWGRLHDGELLPPTSLAAVLTTLPGRTGTVRRKRVDASDLALRDLGRRQRQPSLALRELVGTLDGERCRFPGCTRHRKLHAHHVVYWSEGGATDLDNLVLLCGRHHTLIHQRGFSLVLHPDRGLTVTTAEGVPLPHSPGLPWR